MHGVSVCIQTQYRGKIRMENDKRIEDILIDEIQENRALLVDLLTRVTRLEVKHSWVAGIYGTVGGMLSAIAIYLASWRE